jgi:hypothetical protein
VTSIELIRFLHAAIGKRLYTEEVALGLKRMAAVRMGVGPTIMLHSGAWFDFLAPSESPFTIDDIAHGLANICRYSGQCERFYSVAEHSLLVSAVAKGFEFEALLHDAAEAFLGDITRPLKQMLPEFKRIEHEVETVILQRFELPGLLPIEVKEADLRVLAAEQRQIMPKGTDDWILDQRIVPADVVVRHLTPDEAKRAFLARFDELKNERLLRRYRRVTQGVGEHFFRSR